MSITILAMRKQLNYRSFHLGSYGHKNKKLHPHFDKLSASQGDGVFGHGE
jgi:hypothetical protein